MARTILIQLLTFGTQKIDEKQIFAINELESLKNQRVSITADESINACGCAAVNILFSFHELLP
ncbi:5872_t:CDS:2 [Entrophospora sp. SA101]|nr:5872_t:CDS:2 [Entrophospora sp. SA101]